MRVVFVLTCLVFGVVFVRGQNAIDDEDDDELEGRTSEDDYNRPGEATEDCLCVPFTQCVEGDIVTDGSSMLDPRKSKEPPLSEPYIPPACGPYHVCCRNPEVSTVKPYEHHCGNRNPGGVNPTVLSANTENAEAEFGEWPWQAAILRREGNEFVFKCGGTLIDESHVLTVAHCAKDFVGKPENMAVRLGEWDTQSDTEFMKHEDFQVSDVVLHPDFIERNLHNDIAMVTLAKPVAFKPHIDSVCLPTKSDNFTGRHCVVTGWGTDEFEAGQFSRVLKEISMTILSKKDCQTKLRKTRLGKFFKLHNGFICAGGENGVDMCTGDGGGPLVCYKSDSSYVLVGLVAWGIGCFQENHPGVYMDVSKYLDWITSLTGKIPDEYQRNFSP